MQTYIIDKKQSFAERDVILWRRFNDRLVDVEDIVYASLIPVAQKPEFRFHEFIHVKGYRYKLLTSFCHIYLYMIDV